MKFERLLFSAFARAVSLVFNAFSALNVIIVSFTGPDINPDFLPQQVCVKEHLTGIM
jgi:hypothetical protein